MDLFLIKDAYSSNSAMMDWNGPNFSFGSVAKVSFTPIKRSRRIILLAGNA